MALNYRQNGNDRRVATEEEAIAIINNQHYINHVNDNVGGARNLGYVVAALGDFSEIIEDGTLTSAGTVSDGNPRAVIDSQGNIYAGRQESSGGWGGSTTYYTVKFEADTGNELWSLSNRIPSAVDLEDNIYVRATDGSIYKYDSNGSTVLASTGTVSDPPSYHNFFPKVCSDNGLATFGYYNSRLRLYKYDQDLNLLYSKDVDTDDYANAEAAIAPGLDNNLLLFYRKNADPDHIINSLDLTSGSVLNSVSIYGLRAGYGYDASIDSTGNLLLTSFSEYYYKYNVTNNFGTQMWQGQFQNMWQQRITGTATGHVYLSYLSSANDGYLWRINNNDGSTIGSYKRFGDLSIYYLDSYLYTLFSGGTVKQLEKRSGWSNYTGINSWRAD
jgi:hypothetical protein